MPARIIIEAEIEDTNVDAAADRIENMLDCGVVQECFSGAEVDLSSICVTEVIEEPWQDNQIQFARLLDEIASALDGEQTQSLMKDLCASMDLSPDRVDEIFTRAEAVWEAAKRSEAE